MFDSDVIANAILPVTDHHGGGKREEHEKKKEKRKEAAGDDENSRYARGKRDDDARQERIARGWGTKRNEMPINASGGLALG